MPLKDLISQGWEALTRNRMRSILTMLGIVWGLVSVVILLAYGQGLGNGVFMAFTSMGNNVMVLWPGQTSLQAGGQRAGKKVRYEYADVEAIRSDVPLVHAVSAESVDQLGYKVGTRVISLTTRGVELPYGQMRRLDLDDGRYFDAEDFSQHRRVVILGSEAAKKLFQGAPAVGHNVEIGGQSFDVIGVLRKKVQDSMYEGPDNEDGFIPFAAYQELKSQRDPDIVVFQPLDPSLDLKTLAAVREVIARRHHFDPKDEKATPTWNTIESKQMITAFGLGLQVVLGFIGALTLGVGGVGVMNIMLVSVTERTREIGLRKALGARPKHILAQFLLEALVLTFIGGLVGILISLLITWGTPPLPLYSELYKTANHEGDVFLRMSSSVFVVSFVILTVVGIASGFWPALKAAKLNPIEALRYE